MYGLEDDSAKKKFNFDLEVELKEKPTRAKEIIENADKKIHEIKQTLREGGKGSEMDDLGIILHGYSALQKVISKAAKK